LIPSELIREFEMQMKALRIGNTSLRRAQKLEKRLGVRRLHIKLEGENPSGTHKDRMALLLALDARKKGFDTLAAATCGNYGAALAYVCEKLNMKCSIYIPCGFAAPRRPEIEERGVRVVIVDGDYEAALKAASEEALKNHWYNANPGGSNKDLGIYSYSFIAREIAQSLGRQPDWVSVPVGNGTVLAGVWQGFRAMGMKPRMLGCSNNNSAVRGVVRKMKVMLEVPDLEITEINEPLSGNFLPDGQEAVDSIVESNGAGAEVSDEELVKASKTVKEDEGLDLLPASAGAIWGIAQLESRNHTFVAVATGRGHFD
jgi:threonine synthase